jgi:hypothetical protein
VQAFVKSQEVIFASGEGKRLLVKLHASPVVKRYIVERRGGYRYEFHKVSNAVEAFNDDIDSMEGR